MAQGCPLNHHTNFTNFFLFATVFALEENFKPRGLDVFGYVDDLFEPRHSQSYVFCGDSCKMESIKRHLSCGLT